MTADGPDVVAGEGGDAGEGPACDGGRRDNAPPRPIEMLGERHPARVAPCDLTDRPDVVIGDCGGRAKA